MNCFFTIERCKLHLCQNHGNGKWKKKQKKSGANKFKITILREQALTDEETKEERREQRMGR